ncbi:hypothetical protein WMF18_39805 [Sorangium sp. So ce315]|uniref:hypothetical protein n=1 Tax=Sorangium sp. So ce315 TaxID=3133299 RepID=UPI003F64130A
MDRPGKRPTDDLLTPTLQHAGERQAAPGKRPFRLQSQIWIGVLGGVVPMFLLGMINAGRLRLPAEQRRRMLLLGLAALAAMLAVWSWAMFSAYGQESADAPGFRREIRLANQLLGGLLCLAYGRLQQLADRRFQFAGGEHASLWIPGIAAVLAGLALQFAVLAGLAALPAGARP